MMNPLQRIEYLTRELTREYPQNSSTEVEIAVLLAALETGGTFDRDDIRRIAKQLLTNSNLTEPAPRGMERKNGANTHAAPFPTAEGQSPETAPHAPPPHSHRGGNRPT